MDISIEIMRRNGGRGRLIRAIDHEIATGVWPDMTEHGWEVDEWPRDLRAGDGGRHPRARDVDLARREVLGRDPDRSSASTATRTCSTTPGQYAYYGRVGGCLVTGNEDGVKHCAMNTLYSLQHLGYTIPPQADSGWIGEAGPGPVLPRRGLRRPGERLHQPQHHVRHLEHAPPGADAQGRRRDPRPRQPAPAVGRGLPLRLPEPGVPRLSRSG